MPNNVRAAIERFLLSPAYFILYSIYCVLGIYGLNISNVLAKDLFRPLSISIVVALLFFGILQLRVRHAHTSALIVFVNYLAFFYYGHVRNFLKSANVNIQDNILALIWLALIVAASLFIGRHGKSWGGKTIPVLMNLMTVVFLIFPVMLILVSSTLRAQALDRKVDHTMEVKATPTSPDIYYIILDGQTRSDVMMKNFAYDNSPFIHSLQDMGFYVAECSQANYPITSLSLASSLNMDYLQNISDVYRPEVNNLLYSVKALESNALRNTLTQAGYETIAFESGFTWLEWRDAEHYLSPGGNEITEFEIMILFSSYARILDDFGIVNLDDLRAEHYRQRTRLVLDSFDRVLEFPSPKFVFIHIIAPHPPYGLDQNGNDINPDLIDIPTGYQNQAKFISTAILPQLQKLIRESANPPVIIIQGDHGQPNSAPEDLMKILNAYYLPGHTDQLYPSISPVNSFRVVFNSYFGANLPLLEDVSYYSSTNVYDFTVIPNTCP